VDTHTKLRDHGPRSWTPTRSKKHPASSILQAAQPEPHSALRALDRLSAPTPSWAQGVGRAVRPKRSSFVALGAFALGLCGNQLDHARLPEPGSTCEPLMFEAGPDGADLPTDRPANRSRAPTAITMETISSKKLILACVLIRIPSSKWFRLASLKVQRKGSDVGLLRRYTGFNGNLVQGLDVVKMTPALGGSLHLDQVPN